MPLNTTDPRSTLMESGVKKPGYKAPDWIENAGRYFDEQGQFNPNAYDPSAEYDIQGASFYLASNPEKNRKIPLI